MWLNKKLAQELLYSRAEIDGYRTIDDIAKDSGRWTERRQLVISDSNDELWAEDYEVGLTEMQDIQPWEYDDEVEFYKVERVP